MIFIRYRCRKGFLSAVFLILISGVSSAWSIDAFPRIAASPEAYRYSADTDTGDWQALYKLAFWVSGAEYSADQLSIFSKDLSELSKSVEGMDDYRKGEKVLEFMHDKYLSTYIEKQTRLDTLFSTGRFNCVSSAVLYSILSTSVNLQVQGISTPDHAFCSVITPEGAVDVETTAALGFDPGTKTEFHDAFGAITGYAYVPPRNYRNRNEIDLMYLFSLVISNRIVELEAQGRYAEAVPLAVDRWALLGSPEEGEIFDFLIDRISNYGAQLAKSGREEEVLSWTELAAATFGTHRKLENLTNSAANNYIVRLLRQRNIPEARNSLDRLSALMDEKTYATLELAVSDAELFTALETVKAGGDEKDFEKAVEAAESAGVVNSRRIREIADAWYTAKLERTASVSGWEAALTETEAIILEKGSSSRLEQVKKIYLNNTVAEIYNRAADAYNRQDFETSLEIVNNALSRFPADRRLLSLKKNIENTIKNNR